MHRIKICFIVVSLVMFLGGKDTYYFDITTKIRDFFHFLKMPVSVSLCSMLRSMWR